MRKCQESIREISESIRELNAEQRPALVVVVKSPCFSIARISERISGMPCPRRGHLVPRESCTCRNPCFWMPFPAHNQHIAFLAVSQTDCPDTFGWQMDDTFLILSWYFCNCMQFLSVCISSDFKKWKQTADTLTPFFENFFCFQIQHPVIRFLRLNVGLHMFPCHEDSTLPCVQKP